MPWSKKPASAARAERIQRIVRKTRDENWKRPPRRIEISECIVCDTCLRNCPPEFGAIVDRGIDVVIIPELCSGCPVCVMVCPVDCIYVDEHWTTTGDEMWDHIALSVEGTS